MISRPVLQSVLASVFRGSLSHQARKQYVSTPQQFEQLMTYRAIEPGCQSELRLKKHEVCQDLRFRSGGFNSLYAALMIRDLGHPIGFHFDATAEVQNLEANACGGHPNATAGDCLPPINSSNNVLKVRLLT
jgi:hypothetical protein